MGQIEYDTGMSERLGVRLRLLPDGPVQDAVEIDLRSRYLELDSTSCDFAIGSLLEIERGSTLYLGELQQKTERTAVVRIEHSLDRTKLQAIQDIWG